MLSDILLALLVGISLLKQPRAFIGALSGGAGALIIKLLLRIQRNAIDPFSFPSFHTATAFGAALPLGAPYLIIAGLVGLLRVAEGHHTLMEVLVGALVGLAGSLLSTPNPRKAIHISLSVISGYFMLFHPQLLVSSLLLLGAAATFILRKFPPIKQVYRIAARREDDVGPITLSLGIFIASLFGTGPLAALSLGLVDGLAGIREEGKGKSLVGFLRGVAGSLVAGYLLRGLVDWRLVVLLPLSAVVEYYSPMDDNIIIGVWWGAIGALLALLSP